MRALTKVQSLYLRYTIYIYSIALCEICAVSLISRTRSTLFANGHNSPTYIVSIIHWPCGIIPLTHIFLYIYIFSICVSILGGSYKYATVLLLIIDEDSHYMYSVLI